MCTTSLDYGANGTAKEGLVAGLLEGLQAGRFVAYDPDDLSRVMSYEEVLERMREFDGQLGGAEEEMWTLEEEEDPGLMMASLQMICWGA